MVSVKRRLTRAGNRRASPQGGQDPFVVAEGRRSRRGAEATRGLGLKADRVAADNSNDDEALHLVDVANAKLGKFDILVNNADATWGTPTEDHPIYPQHQSLLRA
jgi:NAD(P)-dependent dehydrogenase (short-subunit alcohol dehydrogenase family)